MTTLVWFYLGGIVGWASYVAMNEDAARGLKRSVYRVGLSAMLGFFLGLVLWPLVTLISLLFSRRLLRHVDKLEETSVVELNCSVCGLKDEARIASKRWLQYPPYWYLDAHNNDAIFCSYQCAKYFADPLTTTKGTRRMEPRDFGWALHRLRAGQKVCRKGWNGKGMWLVLVLDGSADGVTLEMLPWIGMKTVDHKFVPWLASQTDVLAEDWELAE